MNKKQMQVQARHLYRATARKRREERYLRYRTRTQKKRNPLREEYCARLRKPVEVDPLKLKARRDYNRAWKKANAARIAEVSRRYYQANRESILKRLSRRGKENRRKRNQTE